MRLRHRFITEDRLLQAMEAGHLWYCAVRMSGDEGPRFLHINSTNELERRNASPRRWMDVGDPGWSDAEENDWVICDFDPNPYVDMNRFEIMSMRASQTV